MRTDPDCIFCKIVAGDIPCFKLFEDNHTLAFMDINPANSGHVLAVPKEHWEDVYAVPDSIIASTAQTAKRIAEATNRALHPHGINLVQANGPGAAQSVFHFHIHVLPREIDDELKLNWGPKPGDISDIEASFAKIKAQLT